MKTPKQREIEQNILLAKFLIGAGSTWLGRRIVELCKWLFNRMPYTRRIDIYDVVGTVIALSLTILGVYMFGFWKKRRTKTKKRQIRKTILWKSSEILMDILYHV